MSDDVIWCEDCKFFGHADMGGEGWCDTYEAATWYGKNAMDCPYFKRKRQGGRAMGEVIDIEANLPHIVAELICVKCGKRWIGVWPEATPLRDLECENCGAGYVIKTGQDLEDE